MSAVRNPRRRGGRGRLAALVVLAAAIAGGGLLGAVSARKSPQTALQPASLASEAAPAGSASSSWYCPGAPGPAAHAGATEILLANAAARSVQVGVTVVDTGGSRRRRTLELGPHAETVVVPAQLVDGAWLAARVEVAGGAVSASELVDGRVGRTVTACASEVAPRWYFASGSTREGSALSISLFNPTPNLAVVDLSFVTSSGPSAPAPFQGLVIAPWTLRVLTVGEYVQDQASVATVVAARSGAVVADELQLFGPAGAAGVGLALGAPVTATRWELPGAEDVAGGASALAVFNPSAQSEHVVVDVRLPGGPVQPFTQELTSQSVWMLPTSQELRIATQQRYTMEVRASGPGVVVARVAAGARHGPASWWSEDVAVTGSQASATRSWVVPSVPAVPVTAKTATAATAITGTSTAPRATASTLVFENLSRRVVRVEVYSWAGGPRHIEVVQAPSLGVATAAAPGGLALVHADGAIAVMGDASPAGTIGVVGIPAVPLR